MESNEERSVQDPKALVEAALFISSDPVPRSELIDLAGTPEDELDFIIEEIEDDLAAEDRGLRLVENNGNYQLRVKRFILPRVKYLAPHQDISRGVLRTLSVIAYNSPVLQKEVIDIRGNGAYDHIDELISRGFVTSKQEGRTKLLAVTQDFLDYFGLDGTEDLRKGEDLI